MPPRRLKIARTAVGIQHRFELSGSCRLDPFLPDNCFGGFLPVGNRLHYCRRTPQSIAADEDILYHCLVRLSRNFHTIVLIRLDLVLARKAVSTFSPMAEIRESISKVSY